MEAMDWLWRGAELRKKNCEINYKVMGSRARLYEQPPNVMSRRYFVSKVEPMNNLI